MKNTLQTYSVTSGPLTVGDCTFFLLYFAISQVTVSLMKQGRPVFQATDVTGGLSVFVEFDTVQIDTDTVQAIGFFATRGEVRYEPSASLSGAAVSDLVELLRLLEPGITDDEIGGLIAAVESWNVPTIAIYSQLADQFPAMLANLSTAFASLE
jgi:hypothetical protein